MIAASRSLFRRFRSARFPHQPTTAQLVSTLEPMEPRTLLSASPVVVGDYNQSGQVEQGDLNLVLSNWGTNFVADGLPVPTAWTNDLPANQIDQAELDAVLTNWGKTIASDADEGRPLELVSGQYNVFELGTPADVDTFTIDAEAGDSLLVSVQETNTFFSGLQITIFDPDGIALEQQSDSVGSDVDQLSLEKSGTYTLIVRDRFGGTGTYGLTAVVANGELNPGGSEATSGTYITGTLEPGELEAYTIFAESGDSVLAAVQETNTFFSSIGLDIFAPDGTLLETATDSVGADVDQLSVTQTGLYTVVFRDQGEDSSGGFGATIVVANGELNPGGSEATSGTYITGTLEPGELEAYTIFAESGDSVLAAVQETNTFFSSIGLDIFAPDGTLLETATDSVGADVDQLSVTQTGLYTVVFRDQGEDSSGGFGATIVVIDDQLDDENEALVSGDSVVRSLPAGDIDTFTIDAVAGLNLIIFAEETNTFFSSLGLAVFGPDRQLIEETSFSASGDVDQVNLALTGRYTIVVRDAGEDSTGDYLLNVSVETPSSAASVASLAAAPSAVPASVVESRDWSGREGRSASVWESREGSEREGRGMWR